MWGALKADFSEFVSTVTTDAAVTLAAIDGKMDESSSSAAAAAAVPSKKIIRPSVPTSSPPLSMDDIKALLYECDAVFLDPLQGNDVTSSHQDNDMEEKGDDDVVVDPNTSITTTSSNNNNNNNNPTVFDLDSKTDEIAQLLQQDKALEAAFTRLTEHVDYKDFWERYYWRFAEERIMDTYNLYCGSDNQDDDEDDEQQDDEEVLNPTPVGTRMGLKSVTNFLGGAVKRITGEDDDDDEEEDEDDETGEDDNAAAPHTSTSALKFFTGGSGRPPFVLNTAVSEDEGDEEEEEEEEELGWDDDDDDDDDMDQGNAGPDEDDSNEGQIEFKDAEKERLQEELAQAMTERDMLHKTVEMQTEEIKKLTEGVASKDESKQVQALKMQLFEKDSELAALRARVEDDTGNNQNTSEEEMSLLQKDLARRDSTIEELRKSLQRLELSQDVGKDLQNELDSMRKAMTELQNENNTLRQAEIASKASFEKELALSKKELSVAQANVVTLTSQVSTLDNDLTASKSRVSELEKKLEATMKMLQAKETELANCRQALQDAESSLEAAKMELANRSMVNPSSPGSSSTGVKIPADVPEPASVPTISNVVATNEVNDVDDDDDDKDSDWGDW